MHLCTFAAGDWNVADFAFPIPEGMPFLVDDDLLFEDDGGGRATTVVNRWLRELPTTGAASQRTWMRYAHSLCEWLRFLAVTSTDPLGERGPLKDALAAYAGYRIGTTRNSRWENSTWNLHITALSQFYRWAVSEGKASATPFTYSPTYRSSYRHRANKEHNHAKLRAPKSHSTVSYLTKSQTALFTNILAGLDHRGNEDRRLRSRLSARNAAITKLVLASGLRRNEFTYLSKYELPPLPIGRTTSPILFPIGGDITKGRKQRTTWISHDALAAVYEYIELDRAAALDCMPCRPRLRDALIVEGADSGGAHVNGERRRWQQISPEDRLRVVDMAGEPIMIALTGSGAPFRDWATVYRRAAEQLRTLFVPQFPHVHPHKLRHTFAVQTLETLVSGYYIQAMALREDVSDDAGLALYLTRQDPLMVLRDLMGHSSVTTTQHYLRCLDMTRVYQDAQQSATDH